MYVRLLEKCEVLDCTILVRKIEDFNIVKYVKGFKDEFKV